MKKNKKTIDKFLPYLFILFFLLIIVKSVYTVIVANKSFSGLIEKSDDAVKK